MAFSFNEVGAKGVGDTITIPFPYIHRDHIFVRVDGELVSSTLYEFSSSSTLLCLTGFPVGTVTRVERGTPPDDLPSEQTGPGVFDWRGANKNDTHLLYIAQERADLEATVIASAGQVAADLVSTTAKAAGATAAASTATTKASEASASASAAASSASTATTKAAEAAEDAANLGAALAAFEDFMFLADWGSIIDTPGTTTDYGDLSA